LKLPLPKLDGVGEEIGCSTSVSVALGGILTACLLAGFALLLSCGFGDDVSG